MDTVYKGYDVPYVSWSLNYVPSVHGQSITPVNQGCSTSEGQTETLSC